MFINVVVVVVYCVVLVYTESVIVCVCARSGSSRGYCLSYYCIFVFQVDLELKSEMVTRFSTGMCMFIV